MQSEAAAFAAIGQKLQLTQMARTARAEHGSNTCQTPGSVAAECRGEAGLTGTSHCFRQSSATLPLGVTPPHVHKALVQARLIQTDVTLPAL
jgi:hypothetical protein